MKTPKIKIEVGNLKVLNQSLFILGIISYILNKNMSYYSENEDNFSKIIKFKIKVI